MFREETKGYVRVRVARELKALRETGAATFEEEAKRLLQGLFLVTGGAVRACEYVLGDVLVRGSDRREYRVGDKRCECADFFFRGERVCKHQHARRLFLLAEATEALLATVDLSLLKPSKATRKETRPPLRPPTPQAQRVELDPDEIERRWRNRDEQLGSV